MELNGLPGRKKKPKNMKAPPSAGIHEGAGFFRTNPT
jgi:hypothetical protein